MEVIPHREFADGQDGADFGIGFAFSYPAHYLVFTLAQVTAISCRISVVGRKGGKGRNSAQRRIDAGQQELHSLKPGSVELILRAEKDIDTVVAASFVANAMQHKRAHSMQSRAEAVLNIISRMQEAQGILA